MSKIKQFLANKQKHVIVDDGVRLNHNSLIAYSKFLRKEEDNDEEDEDEE